MWHVAVYEAINTLITLFALVLGVIAFIHCATQRSDAFSAINTIQKPAWLAVLGVATVMALLTQGWLLFNLIAIGAAAFYLLDVRPGLRDIANGHGSW
ncbi:DUF2516 family protein [Natronosporangium hydrolyticum]|uniref:DUF2516 family protein n=1 Tax=Natronosporangium hydrolyticum TaxID=2811111 RepID=A0A895Y9T2_9ACTN|nr:DUF2516 family protein [Natronosporangium hydrolyticum]QSB14507.1 DUF2516 family protein [Natronosporangium hydrolyticum]